MQTRGSRGAAAVGRTRGPAKSRGRAGRPAPGEISALPLQRRLFENREGPRFVDLFCGVGGFSLGCIVAGLVPAAAFDNDPEAIKRYEMNLGPHAYELDLRAAEPAAILERCGGLTPDIVVGGPPCQGFSFMGKRDPADLRSELTRSFTRMVIALKPRAFAMENVPGIFSMGSIASEVRDAFRAAGYANASWLTLNAADFGVPQRRRRAVLLGSLSGPAPTNELLAANAPARVTVGEALRGVPRPRARSTVARSPFVPYEREAELGSYDAAMRNPAGAVSGIQKTIHADATVRRFKALLPGEVDEPTSSRRLDPAGLAPALRAGTRSRTACRPIHPHAWRVITVREAARLHSFPDSYDFSPVVSLAHVQIGNSVPPRMAAAVGRWLLVAASQDARDRDQAVAGA